MAGPSLRVWYFGDRTACIKTNNRARAPKSQASLHAHRMVWDLVAVVLGTRFVPTSQSPGFPVTSTPERRGG